MSPKRNYFFTWLVAATIAISAGGANGQEPSHTQRLSSSSKRTTQQKTSSKPNRYTLTNISISPGTGSAQVGGTLQLVASGLGSDGINHTVTDHVTWTSSAPGVATVSKGLVTAIGPGTALITAARGVSSSSTITVTTAANPVASDFFSITTHSRTDWPDFPIKAIRLWDTNTYWGTINTADGVYDFTTLDRWLSTAQTNKVDLIYTFGETPGWASSSPSLVCGESNVPLGSCAPPNDLNEDGTGTDKHWKDFVTTIVTHAAGQIKYWEIWNEPTITGYWQGNNSQMLRMAQDAYSIIKSIDPNAMVTTPTPSTGINGVANWMGPYLALGGGQYADIISFHGYSWHSDPGVWPIAEDIVPLIDNLKAVLVTYGQDKKPLWCTEGSWGYTGDNGFTDPDLRAAFVARHYLLQQSEGVARYYWYAWDNLGDGLWDYDTGTMTEAGIAYQQVQNWITGATPSGTCTATGTIWTCNYTRTDGLQAQVIWDTSQTCSSGSCTTTNVSVGSQYVSYLDVAGGSHTIKNSTVPVGAKPIFVQNQ